VCGALVALGALIPAGTAARGVPAVHTYHSAAKTKIEGYGRAVPIKVADSFSIDDLDVGVRITETPTGEVGDDLVLLLLISPQGEAIQLDYGDEQEDLFGAGPNDCGPGSYFTFDDEGTEKPADALSNVDGQNAQGTWRLFVRREDGGKPMLGCWQLDFESTSGKLARQAPVARGTETGTYTGDVGAVPDDPCTGGECIPRGKNAFAAFEVPVPDKGKVSDVDVKVTVFDGDVYDTVGALIGADGEAVELWNLINSPGNSPTTNIGENSDCGATLTDGAQKSIQNGGNLNGKLKPRKKLSQLNGSKTKGEWFLLIEDSIEHNFGNLHPFDTEATVTCNKLKIKRRT
jgi:subtilisin-like proprotein convertase family protein